MASLPIEEVESNGVDSRCRVNLENLQFKCRPSTAFESKEATSEDIQDVRVALPANQKSASSRRFIRALCGMRHSAWVGACDSLTTRTDTYYCKMLLIGRNMYSPRRLSLQGPPSFTEPSIVGGRSCMVSRKGFSVDRRSTCRMAPFGASRGRCVRKDSGE